MSICSSPLGRRPLRLKSLEPLNPSARSGYSPSSPRSKDESSGEAAYGHHRPTSEASDTSARTPLGDTSRLKRNEHRSNGDSSPPTRGGESSQTNLETLVSLVDKCQHVLDVKVPGLQPDATLVHKILPDGLGSAQAHRVFYNARYIKGVKYTLRQLRPIIAHPEQYPGQFIYTAFFC